MRFIKKNIFFLIFSFLSLFVVFYAYISIINNTNSELELIDQMIYVCKNDERYIGQEICDEYISGDIEVRNNNFFVRFNELSTITFSFLNIVFCLVLFIMSIYSVNKIFKTGFSLLMLKREKYSQFLKTIFGKVYRYIWFFPIFMLLIFGVCAINASFDVQAPINSGISWGRDLMSNVPLFIILYVLNLILYSIFYLNIALIVVRKQHNFFLAVIESFLLVIAIELFFEIVVQNVVFVGLLNNYKVGLIFNIINPITFRLGEVGGILNLFIFSISCFLVSSFLVFIVYKDKEKLIIDCEKNNKEEVWK